MPSQSLQSVFTQAKDAEANGKSLYAATLFSRLGLFFRKKKKWEQAIVLFRKALALCPEAIRFQLYLGDCQWRLGEEEEALDSLGRYFAKTETLNKTSEYRSYAEKVLAKDCLAAIDLNKGGAPKKTFRFEIPASELSGLVAKLEKELGPEDTESQAEIARAYRSRAEALIGEHDQTKIDLALAYFEMGLMDEALAFLKQIKRENNLFPIAQSLLSQVHASQGDVMKALEVLLACLRDERVKGEAAWACRYELVSLYVRLGDKQKAAEHFSVLEKESQNYRDLGNLKRALE